MQQERSKRKGRGRARVNRDNMPDDQRPGEGRQAGQRAQRPEERQAGQRQQMPVEQRPEERQAGQRQQRPAEQRSEERQAGQRQQRPAEQRAEERQAGQRQQRPEEQRPEERQAGQRAQGPAEQRSEARQAGQRQQRPAEQRPGEERQVVQRAAQPAQVPVPGTSRSLHRGVSRNDPPRPGDVEKIAKAMAEIEIPDTRTGPNVKQGTNGSPVDIITNYFRLTHTPNWRVYQYHVDFAPTVESSRMRRILLSLHREMLGQCYIFDGMSDLKTITKLENEVTEVFSQRNTDGENIRITMKRVAELNSQHPELGRLFNTQMRRNLHHLKYILLGRHFFDGTTVKEVPDYKLQIWQGVVTSIRMQERHLMMVVDTTHKVIRQTTGLDILMNARRSSPRDFKEEAIKELVGAVVMTRYNNRTYRIEDICWDEKPRNTFSSKDGEISYIDYYLKQYDIRINDQNQPLFLCTSKEKEVKGGESKSKRIMLVPELCSITGLDEKMRTNFRMMKDLANFTKLDPTDRAKNLTTFMTAINSNENIDREMKGWNLGFENRLAEIKGRIVEGELILHGGNRNNQSTYSQETGDFTKEVRSKRMVEPKDLQNWIIFFTNKDRKVATEFLKVLFRVSGPFGMRIDDARECEIVDDRIGTYTRAFKENYHPSLEMAIFVVPNNKKDRYDAIKKLTCLDYPVPSQVIVSRTIAKPNMLMSVATKIGIQLNCKLGGVPWCLRIPLSDLMVIGYDTYHDSSRTGHSAGGFVASVDRNLAKWYSKVNFHAAGGWQELSNHLGMNLTSALRRYREVNGSAPKFILFFRDGVGDGQIRYVREWELKQFKDTIRHIYGENEVRFAFTVVNKRINTRFFRKMPHALQNPCPGTVVDDVVTRYDRYDYYLISQTARQGTVSPTMYNIIEDASGLKPDHMQRLSYKLTHLYFNWSGTISVPAPCQYAHKLAFLAGQSLHRIPSERLDNNLYYL